MLKGSVGGAYPRVFRWSMIIKVRLTFKPNCIVTILNKVRAITCMAGSRVNRFVSLT